MILLKKEPNWTEAKKQLGDPNFLTTVNFCLMIYTINIYILSSSDCPCQLLLIYYKFLNSSFL